LSALRELSQAKKKRLSDFILAKRGESQINKKGGEKLKIKKLGFGRERAEEKTKEK